MLFEFNPYSSLLLIGFTQGLVYTILLLIRGRQEGMKADYWMAGILFLLTLFVSQWMLGFAGWYDARDWHTTVMFYTYFNPFFLLGPVFYCYFLSLTNVQFSLHQYWKHFIPAGIMFAVYLTVTGHDFLYWQLIKGEPFTHFYGTRGPWRDAQDNISYWWYQFPLYSRIHLTVYLILTMRLYRSYRRYLTANFSNVELLQFRWLNWILIIFCVASLVSLLGQILNLFIDIDYIGAWYYYFVVSIAIFVLGIQAYRQSPRSLLQLTFQPEEQEQTTALPATRSTNEAAHKPALDPDLEALRPRLENLMQTERPYLDPDINIRQLADRLNTNTAYLSRLINTGYDLNFNDFINRYRVQELTAKLAAGEYEQFTFLSLAFECGFNSKATFNRAFRKHTGQSPGQYVAQLAEGNE